MVETGIGPQNAERAARFAFDRFPLQEIWILGVAAGTQKGIAPGEAVIAAEVGNSDQAFEMWEKSSAPLREKAENWLKSLKLPYRIGPILTVDRVVSDAADKATLGERHACLALEMEATPIAQAAAQRKIPWVQIRWIADGVEDPLPALEGFIDERGGVRGGRALKALVKNPSLLLELPPFLRGVRRGLSGLNCFLQKWHEDGRMGAS